MRKIILKEGRSNQITLPVTPESFEISFGRRVETVNIHQLGDINLWGGKLMATIQLSCLLPAQNYPFSTADRGPYDYIELLETWIDRKRVLRYIVTGTPVNVQVMLESLHYGERDGTGDVYAQLTLREYPELEAVETTRSKSVGKPRPSMEEPVEESTYVVKAGDTLWSICRAAYGEYTAALGAKLAVYNGRKTSTVLYVGDVYKLPPRSRLE